MTMRRVVRTLGFGAAMVAFGVMLAAPQVVPALMAAPFLARAGEVRAAWAAAFSFQPDNLVTFVAPGFFGDDARKAYWGFFNLWEMCAYVGCVTLVLAAVGVALGRDRRRWALLACTALMLLMAFGKHVPPLYALYTALPGAAMLRGTAKFLSPFSLVVALLAATGVEALARVEARAARRTASGCFAAALIVAGAGFFLDARPRVWDRLALSVVARAERVGLMEGESERALARQDAWLSLVRGAALFALCGGLLLARRRGRPEDAGAARLGRVPGVALTALLLVDLATFNWEYFDPKHGFDASDAALRGEALEAVRREAEGTRVWVRGDRRLNDAMRLGLHAVEGVEPNPPLAFHQLFALGVRKPPDIAPSIYQITRDSPLWRLMALRVVAQPAAMDDRAPAWQQIERAGRTAVYRLPDALPRAFIVRAHATGPLDAAQIEAFPYAERVWLLEEPAADAPEGEGAAGSDAARILAETPNRLEIEAELSVPGWLVVSDNYFPGWRAEVDGRPARIVRANYAFRALRLGKGRHRVVLQFRPEGIDAGFVLCGTAVAEGLGLLLARGSSRRRRRPSGETGRAADAVGG